MSAKTTTLLFRERKSMLAISLVAALLFFIVSMPDTYKVTRKIHTQIADEDGCPTYAGLALHTVVYVIVLLFLLWAGDRSKFFDIR